MDKEQVKIYIANGDKPDTVKVTAEFTVETDLDLMEKADLGKSRQTCKICGASGEFQMWRIIEMQYGTGDAFRYFECPECGTLQIEKFPENIGDYYSGEYYSYTAPQIKLPKTGVDRDERMILDVGCGAGKWLCSVAETNGCVNLYGCDPFIEQDVNYINGVKIKKCSIHKMEGEFDVIYFHDAFEHMSDPHDVFKTIDRLLKDKDSMFEISLPIRPSLTEEIFGMYAFPLDAPRHFFIYSEKALSLLAKRYGFFIEKKVNRVGLGHMILSRGYQLGIKWTDIMKEFYKKEIWDNPVQAESFFGALSLFAAGENQSDHATFTFKRREESTDESNN